MFGNHPLFGGGPSYGAFSRPFRSSGFASAEESLVPFDDRWDGFMARVPSPDELAAMDDAALSARFGLDPAFLSEVVPSAIAEWRQSPSRSLINIVASVGEGAPCGTMFADIATQSRVLASAVVAKALPLHLMRGLKGPDGKPVRAFGDGFAATVEGEGVTLVNDVARAMRAWELRNRARVDTGMARLPSLLYRGIRNSTVGIDGFRWNGDRPQNLEHCRLHDLRTRKLSEVPFAEASGTPILSFTSVEAVAQRFTQGEGMIAEIDPSRVMVVAAWSTDGGLAGKDPVLKVHEKEWIVRFDPGYVLAPEEIRPWDRTLAYSTKDPAGIEMLHHYDHARYVLEGRHVEAYFRYNSNGRGGRIVFQVDDNMWSKGRQTWKKEIGFDPVPGPGREAENLVYFHRDPYLRHSTRHYEPYVRDEEPEPARMPGR